MKTRSIISIVFAIALLWSCDKEEYTVTEQHVRIVNKSDFLLDTVVIFAPMPSLFFSDIRQDSSTSYEYFTGLNFTTYWKIIIDTSVISIKWDMPTANRQLDPTRWNEDIQWHSGKYTFGIYNNDTTIQSIYVGLLEYEK